MRSVRRRRGGLQLRRQKTLNEFEFARGIFVNLRGGGQRAGGALSFQFTEHRHEPRHAQRGARARATVRHAADVVGFVRAHGDFQLLQLPGGLVEKQVNQFAQTVRVAVGQIVQDVHLHRRFFNGGRGRVGFGLRHGRGRVGFGRRHGRGRVGFGRQHGYGRVSFGRRRRYGHIGFGHQHGYGHISFGHQHGYGRVSFGHQHGYGHIGFGRRHGYGHIGFGRRHGYGHIGFGRRHGYGHIGFGRRRGYGHIGFGRGHGRCRRSRLRSPAFDDGANILREDW